jgi:RNA polymerase sigma factor (sigma-70 family)
MDDQTILQLIRSGNNDLALNGLYRNFAAIRKLVRSGGGSTSDAEDVFQDALIILIRKAKADFQLTAQLSTYLYGVSRLLWNEQIRKRKRLKLTGTLLDDSRRVVWDGAEEADVQAYLQQEDRARLAEKVLNDLKDRCRELLLLFYQGRQTLQAITGIMGYGSENSTKNQKYKCLEAARNRLKEWQHQSQTL